MYVSSPNLSLCLRLLALCAAFVLGGCASQAQKQFPDFYAAERPESLDVLVDVTVLSDLSGKDLGVDPARNRASAEIVREHIDALLVSAGYRVRTLRSGYGLAWDQGTAAVFLADGMQSTGLPYTGPEPVGNNDPWINADARAFLRNLVLTARMRRNDPDEAETQSALAALKTLARPAALQQVQGRYLLAAHTTVYDAADAKEFASIAGGLAFGVGMAALGSTVVLVPFLPTSYTNVELVLFDTETGELAWSYVYCATNDALRSQQYAVREAMAVFPAHAGRKTRLPKAVWKEMQP